MSTPWALAFVVQWLVIVTLAVVVVGLLKRTAGALEHAEASLTAPVSLGGIPVASRTPDFTVYNVSSSMTLTAKQLLTRATVLLFMERHCPPCRQLAAEISSTFDRADVINLQLVLDLEDGVPDWLPEDLPVVFQRRKELSRAFENTVSPQAYLVDPDRLVLAKRVIRSVDDLREMNRNGELSGGDARTVHIVR